MKQCPRCSTMIPVFAVVCPNCTRDIGYSSDSSDGLASLFAFIMLGGMLYWFFGRT